MKVTVISEKLLFSKLYFFCQKQHVDDEKRVNCLAKALSLRQSYILGRFRLLNKVPEQKPLEGNDTVCVFPTLEY